jgi:hypothetical protein
MKYLLAGLTFIAGFILFVLLHVMTKREIGGFFSFLFFALILSATGFVFKKAGGGKAIVNKNPIQSDGHGLSKLEIKDFNKVFTADNCKNLNLISTRVSSSKIVHADYIVSLESDDYSKLEIVKIEKLLSKRFYNISRIVLKEYTPDDKTSSYLIEHQI